MYFIFRLFDLFPDKEIFRMNKYHLSSTQDRIAGTIVALLLSSMMALLVFLLSKDILTLIITLICVILVLAVLIFYVLSLYKAACTTLPDEKKLVVNGFPDCSYDLTDAVSAQTVSYKSGSLATRMIVFYDEGNEVIASVPTFFFSRQGATAEPVAKEIAAALGLSFIPSLEPWEYDSKLRREREKEVAQKEKETRKRKFQALKNKLLRRPNTETSAPSPLEEMDLNLFEDSSDGINYDALDDEK